MAATEPGKIRNVAVVGHRGTGKTSLVEALLYQTGEVNRLGTIEAGTTVSDSDEDEQKRQLSISLSLAHTEWQGRKINLVDCPGDPSFQGEARCALRVVEGALVVVSGVMGFEVGTARVKKLAEELGLARVRRRQHARPRARRLLPHARPDPGAVLARSASPCTSRSAPSTSSTGIVDVLHMCAYMSPDGQKEGEPVAIPDDDGGARAGVPREAARRGGADRRGADGALPRGRGARSARRGRRAEARRHARRGLPGRRARSRRRTSARTRCSTSSSRACRRPRSGARRSRWTARRRPRSSSRRSPTRSPGRSTSSGC